MASDIKLYKTLLENLYEGVYLVDESRRITYWNAGATELLGYEESEVIGQRCSRYILLHLDSEGQNLCKSNCPVKNRSSKTNRSRLPPDEGPVSGDGSPEKLLAGGWQRPIPLASGSQ